MSQLVITILVTVLLVISAWLDIRERLVSGIVLGIFGATGIMMYIVFRPISLLSAAGGVGIGLIIILVSKITNGGIGMGDGVLLCVIGIYVGFYRNIEMFLTALVIAAVWGVVLIVIKKAGKKTEMPFVPFLLLAHVIIQISKIEQLLFL